MKLIKSSNRVGPIILDLFPTKSIILNQIILAFRISESSLLEQLSFIFAMPFRIATEPDVIPSEKYTPMGLANSKVTLIEKLGLLFNFTLK